ncbi:tRNA (guanosine(37)-N1)-methyltransferase TrmD [bacterium]|nr:tRNA (guanosine(37)-N1)-methyltransferase TrmD [bacterium]
MSLQFHSTFITLFPEMFPGHLAYSLAGRAMEQGIWGYKAVQLRDFAKDKHGTVDDTPYGGGAGMVLKCDVMHDAIEKAKEIALAALPEAPRLVAMCARGRKLGQADVKSLVNSKNIVIISGRFEGIDQRVLDHHGVEEFAIGDYVLSGGEPAALTLVDACVRLIPGVMGEPLSADEESFSAGLLEYPQYTRPPVWEGREIPEILTSGHHAKVKAWRQEEAEKTTRERRPDLWQAYRK